MPKKTAVDRRVEIDVKLFGPAQLLALCKVCDPKSKAVTEARALLKPGVHQVNVAIHVTGDIEIGCSERVPAKFETEKHLVAALALLSPAQRKQILKATPTAPKTARILAAAELEAFKSKRPKGPGPAKLTPHLKVVPVSVIQRIPTPVGTTAALGQAA